MDSFTRVASTSSESLKSLCGSNASSANASVTTQQKISKLAEITARTFFDVIVQSRNENASSTAAPPEELNFSQVLEFADKFNKVFVDTVTIKWNENSKSPDYTQHCDSGEEDEVFENSLYQPCPDGPNQYEPVYENSGGENGEEETDGDPQRSLLGDVTPTPPTESHYSAMIECESGSGGGGGHYDTPSGTASLEEKLMTHLQAHGFKVSSNGSEVKKTETNATSGGEEGEKRMKASSFQLSLSTTDQSQQQNGRSKPKLKSAMIDLNGGSNKRSSDSPKQQSQVSEVKNGGPAPVVKKESVLEVRVSRTDSPSSWQSCRLVLLKTQGGFMLNVHTPPESDKVYCSIFCPLIYEIGEATEAQFGKTADRVLVIKAQDNVAVTLRARNYEDKHDWICVLRENTDAKSTKRVIYTDSDELSPMTPTQDMYEKGSRGQRVNNGGAVYSYENGSPNHSRRASNTSISSSYSRDSLDRNQYVTAQQAAGFDSFDRQKSAPNPSSMSSPYIYQDGAVYVRQNSHPGKAVSQMNVSEKNNNDLNSSGGHVPRISSCGDFINSANGGPPPSGGAVNRGNSVYGSRIAPLEQLKSYPWFHGKLPRETASKMVLAQSNPVTGHGIYLVRQSETNENEFTLTFNYEGKAKHLRINVDAQSGVCQLQNLQFKSLRHLIETYTKEKLPIDVKGNSDITLKSYIANFGAGSASQLQPHKRNKSVDFNIERNTEVAPNGAMLVRPGGGGGHYGVGGQRPAPAGGPSKVSNSQGVYYASHK